MRRTVALLITALACWTAAAQQVVIDPSQIAASATNAAEQVDYMLDQLGELASVGEQLGQVRDYIDDVFGEDGAGGRTITVLRDLGTLERLTEAFNNTLKQTERYAAMMKEMGQYRLSDANMMLGYMRNMRTQIEMALETARHILSTLGFSRKEKKEELDKLIGSMEEDLERTRRMDEIEIETTTAAEGIYDFAEYVDMQLDPTFFVEKMKPYGQMEDAGRGTLGTVSVILLLLGIISSAYGLLVYVRGGLAGDATVDNVFLRIGAGMTGGMLLINLLAMTAGLNL